MQDLKAKDIDDLPIPDKPLEIRHSKCTGLLIRVQPVTGGKTWYWEHRTLGRKHRIKIGRYPEFTVSRAVAAADRLRTQVRDGRKPAEERRTMRQSMRLSDLVDVYLEWARVHRPKSAQFFKSTLLVSFEPLLNKPVLSVDLPTLTEWKTWRKSTPLDFALTLPTAHTINKNVKVLHALFNWAVAEKHIQFNPIAGVKLEKQDDPPEMRPLTRDEEAKILEHLDGYREDFRALFLVALDTGGRRGELLALDWKHVDLTQGRITLIGTTTKSAKTRLIPLTPRAKDALKALRATQSSDLVFTLSKSYLDKLWRQVCAEAVVSGVRWHDLRHSFGTRLALLGVPTLVIKSLMGHSTIRITERYLHAADTAKDDAIALLGAGQ